MAFESTRKCEWGPTIRGVRVTVDPVLNLLGNGYTADDIVLEYLQLEKDDVQLRSAEIAERG